MARFIYRGTDDGGADRKGVVEAESLTEALARVRGEGVIPSTVTREEEILTEPMREVDAFTFFNRSLAALTRVGIPLAGA
ncbi:MAG: hypothetical protein ACYTAF_14610, partial [Planctomycetota bacterium]